MRKKRVLPVLALTLALGGCGGYPQQAADGAAWDENWTMLGPVLGIEEPGNGLTLLENNSVLTGDDLYYAAWTAGDPEPYTNEDGDEVDLYDAQLYVLVMGCAGGDYARQNVEDWIARAEETYTVTDTRTETRNGQDYTVLTYTCGSATNPYSRGAAAFTVYGTYAVSVELACQAEFTGDEDAILPEVLDRCHYSADAAEKEG